MHELSVTQNVLNIALKHAEQHHAARITRISLVIGQLSSIVDDSVQFYWDIIAEDTIAEGAQLDFKRLPAQMECYDCGHRFNMNDTFCCPMCESRQVSIISGDEFFVESIDIEEGEGVYTS